MPKHWYHRRAGWIPIGLVVAATLVSPTRTGRLLGAAAKLAGVQTAEAAPPRAGAPAAVPVAAATVSRTDMPIRLSALGSATAFNTVTVRPRVDGQLVHVSSREGQFVKQGDQLAQIDPRPFQVQLEQAVPVDAFDRAGAAHLASGKVLTVDNEIDHGAAARQDERGARPAGHQAGTHCPLGPRDHHDR